LDLPPRIAIAVTSTDFSAPGSSFGATLRCVRDNN